jgi:melibiose permease
MAAVVTIVAVNTALYITSNLLIYFFKYDLGGKNWYADYTLFNTVSGGSQILAMMLLYPLLRKIFSNMNIFYVSLAMSMAGYLIILGGAASGKGNIYIYLIPGILVLAASGMNNVLVTIFLANTVDYGQVTLGSRDESVIFSMQTFVVKLASGVAAFVASITLQFLNLSDEATTEAQQTMDMSVGVSDASRMGLRAVMTLIPIAVLIFAFIWFRKKYILTDTKMEEIAEKLGKNKN